MEVKILAEAGDGKTVYICFEHKGKTIKNSLFRLRHPGNKAVMQWRESSMIMDVKADKYSVSTVGIMNNFLQNCVSPVEYKDPDKKEAFTVLEQELIEKIGENTGGKLTDVDSVPPYMLDAWSGVQTRFLSGDIFLDLLDEPEPGRNKKSNK